ncbi:MAG: hypothetical protein DRI71_06505 [Bacteroidetes bacterium]|nr:MAG: hypothetical protein DRI71_06505 [Bacteroidota bacterium]
MNLGIVKHLSIILIFTSLLGCTGNNIGPGSNNNVPGGNDEGWAVPTQYVLDGGVGKDGIRSIDNPAFLTVAEADFINDDELVIIVNFQGIIKVYPHKVLDYHEIVNDVFQDSLLTISYCPLTGTAAAWKGNFSGINTDFGVSGLLYNNNLILYDRETDSYWSQMKFFSIFGTKVFDEVDFVPVVETTWGTFKQMNLPAEVLRGNVGSSTNYSSYPYGNYRTDNNYLLFPLEEPDDRLGAKERVLFVVDEDQDVEMVAINYPSPDLVQNVVVSNDVAYIRNNALNLMVALPTITTDGVTHTFEYKHNALPVILIDEEGNEWDVFGKAVSGPRTGEQLTPIYSMVGYFFPISSIFREANIINYRPIGG